MVDGARGRRKRNPVVFAEVLPEDRAALDGVLAREGVTLRSWLRAQIRGCAAMPPPERAGGIRVYVAGARRDFEQADAEALAGVCAAQADAHLHLAHGYPTGSGAYWREKRQERDWRDREDFFRRCVEEAERRARLRPAVPARPAGVGGLEEAAAQALPRSRQDARHSSQAPQSPSEVSRA